MRGFEVGQGVAELLALAGTKYFGMACQDLFDEGGARTRFGSMLSACS
jgi:hypothetical protein